MSTLRAAVPGDRARIVRTTTLAFADDPLVRWFFPDRYDELGPLFFGTLFDMRVHDGEVWTTDDSVSLSMWNPCGGLRGDDSARERLWRDAATVFGEVPVQRFLVWGPLVEPLLPPQPHWYLGILATHPDWQRQGFGRRVLVPVVERADEAGEPIYLETATPEDVAFYSGLGFTVRHELQVPDGPMTWGMWREPGASQWW